MKVVAPEIIEHVRENLTPQRKQRIDDVLAHRTRHLKLVVQDVHDPHNVAACMRSADAFGIHDVHVVSLRSALKKSTTSRGAIGWLTVTNHVSIESCVEALRAQGCRIVAALPDPSAHPVWTMPIAQPTAILFGNEKDGIDPTWRQYLDATFTIPMVGMVQSLNISVSAAVTMAILKQRLVLEHKHDLWRLSPSACEELRMRWATETFSGRAGS